MPWRAWGPYLSERQWGTVREDYSDGGDAWSYFSHDQARSRAYRWGEDGLAGISDDKQRLCLALALWNERDPILKERLFGLTNAEGNHGEDVKEYYFYVDNLPTHSYQRYLYKYPQAEFPYNDLVAVNRERSRQEFEYELIDTGIFDDGRYFDVEVEHAKAAPEDILLPRHRAQPLGRRTPCCTCCRRCGSATRGPGATMSRGRGSPASTRRIRSSGPSITSSATSTCYAEPEADLLFCENETNAARVFGAEARPRFPQGRHRRPRPPRRGHRQSRRRGHQGGRARPAARCRPAGRLRCWCGSPGRPRAARGAARRGGRADRAAAGGGGRVLRRDHAARRSTTTPSRSCARRWPGCCGPSSATTSTSTTGCASATLHPLRAPVRRGTRNESWFHMFNHDVVSMPDKWEYPWYAAWDLAFHCIPLAMVDPDFAKGQIDLMLSQDYLHPTGQMPAYEWNFGDVNPPVHAFAALFLQNLEADLGEVDLPFLEESFARLLLNFTWWVNRKDPTGRNVFEGGFLGLDNIGVFDRSAALPTGGTPGAGRRHRLDGDVQPEHARAGPGPARARRRLRAVRAQVRRALLLDRRGHGPARRAPRRDVGRGGRLLLRRAAPARRHRHPAEGALAGRPAAALRHHRHRGRHHRALSADRRAGRARSSSATRTCWPTSPTRWCPG